MFAVSVVVPTFTLETLGQSCEPVYVILVDARVTVAVFIFVFAEDVSMVNDFVMLPVKLPMKLTVTYPVVDSPLLSS